MKSKIGYSWGGILHEDLHIGENTYIETSVGYVGDISTRVHIKDEKWGDIIDYIL